MTRKLLCKFAVSFSLIISIFAGSIPVAVSAQTAQIQTADYSRQLQAIEEKLEKRRGELGIPGMALVIVKDDKIIYLKGLGYKDFEKKTPATPDTEFAIGSATKAFTALSVLMSQDEGKLSLDDSPKKYLAYFKINDAEIDKNIQIRDLMSHSSGLNRTDLAWITGKLNREEIIKVAGEAKPQAKLREKWQYQNVMFVAAGEIVGAAQKTPLEKFIPERIFKPLGMTNSTMSVKEMEKTKDYSFGYDYNFDTKETRRLPIRDIDTITAAGSINSSAKDMAEWLKFVLNGGTINGKRLVSEKSYEEWTKPQMKITPDGKMNYGLGWFLQEWNGLKVVQHGGNIDGFNSLVAMIPERRLGFVMLTNVSGSPLGNELMPIVWDNILGNPAAVNQTADAQKEIGKYRFAAAGFDIEVKMENGKLVAAVPGQPVYTLETVGARRYRLSGAPDGFFATFKDDSLYLEQPQGNYTLPKVNADGKIVAVSAAASQSAKELVGKYESEQNKGRFVEIKDAGDKTTLNLEGQQPYELTAKSQDVFSLLPLPEAYSLKIKRATDGKVAGVIIAQPEGEFAFNFVSKTQSPAIEQTMTVDEIMAKTITALGGESNMRKATSRVTKFDLDFIHQGVKGSGTTYEKAPNLVVSDSTLTAVGKPIATMHEYFDGTNGGEQISFAPAEKYTGKQLENTRIASDFYGLLNWKKDLKKADFIRTEKVGEEDCYVVSIEPEKASERRYWISTKTFLPVKTVTLSVSSTTQQTTPIVSLMSDYRAVDGVLMPFKTVSTNPGMGDIVSIVKEVKTNVAIDDKQFAPKN